VALEQKSLVTPDIYYSVLLGDYGVLFHVLWCAIVCYLMYYDVLLDGYKCASWSLWCGT